MMLISLQFDEEHPLRGVTLRHNNDWFGGDRMRVGGTSRLSTGLSGSAKLQWFRSRCPSAGVLTRIAEHPTNRIDELLAWNISFVSVEVSK